MPQFVLNSLGETALFHGSRDPVGSITFTGADFDATIEEDDLIVACITSSGDTGTYSVSSPWFQIVDGTRSAMWAKWAGSSESSASNSVSTPSGQEVAILAFILRGIDPTGTVIATGANIKLFAQGGVNGSLASPSLQTSETGAVYVVSGGSSTVTVIDETSGDITDFVRYRNHSGGDGRPTYLGADFDITPNVDYTRTISFPSSTNSSGEVLAAILKGLASTLSLTGTITAPSPNTVIGEVATSTSLNGTIAAPTPNVIGEINTSSSITPGVGSSSPPLIIGQINPTAPLSGLIEAPSPSNVIGEIGTSSSLSGTAIAPAPSLIFGTIATSSSLDGTVIAPSPVQIISSAVEEPGLLTGLIFAPSPNTVIGEISTATSLSGTIAASTSEIIGQIATSSSISGIATAPSNQSVSGVGNTAPSLDGTIDAPTGQSIEGTIASSASLSAVVVAPGSSLIGQIATTAQISSGTAIAPTPRIISYREPTDSDVSVSKELSLILLGVPLSVGA